MTVSTTREQACLRAGTGQRQRPETAASTTCGWSVSADSSWAGQMLKPPETIMSSAPFEYEEEAVGIEVTNVLGVHPAVTEPAAGELLVAPVEAHLAFGLRHDLALLAEGQFVAERAEDAELCVGADPAGRSQRGGVGDVA